MPKTSKPEINNLKISKLSGTHKSNRMRALLRSSALAGFVVITACAPSDNNSAKNEISSETIPDSGAITSGGAIPDGGIIISSEKDALNKNKESLSRTDTAIAAPKEQKIKQVKKANADSRSRGLVEYEVTNPFVDRTVSAQPAPMAGLIGGQVGRTQMPSGYDNAIAPVVDRENYAHLADNPVHLAQEDPVSTFSIDVDTGGYANVRRFLEDGDLPREDAVRIEELVNYFSYDYPLPEDRAVPFRIFTEVAPTPWNPETKLLHIGIKAFDIPDSQRPAANLVFLVDVSGSMHSRDKLPLLKSSLRLLVDKMTAQDRISLVTYAGSTRVVLPATPGNEKAKIRTAIEALTSGGSTHGSTGITLAYAEAQKEFIEDGINRILLATDGDLNVGMVNFEALKDMVERKRKSGVSLTTIGFGTGNYNDHLLEQLADAGNGNYAYIDSLSEARKVLVEQMSSTLITVARDVKIQVEFNPAVVAEYRLIGYENRILQREDFNNDKVDAGEIGAGHTVTALYEIALVGSKGRQLDPLRYNVTEFNSDAAINRVLGSHEELAFVKLRYKDPARTGWGIEGNDTSKLLEYPIKVAAIKTADEKTDNHFRFSAAVAAFGQILKGGKYTGDMNLQEVRELAQSGLGDDPFGYRREFLGLVDLANSMDVASR